MRRQPQECRFRQPLRSEAGVDRFACDLVRQIVGRAERGACPVRAEACAACCRRPLPSPAAINPVIASLVYDAAAAIAARPGTSGRALAEALRAQQFVLDKLELMRTEPAESATGPGGAGPHGDPTAGRPLVDPGPAKPALRWAVGLLTAPRGEPTIDRTLRSLRRAGFDEVHVFAEPGSWIPAEFDHLPVTLHGGKLGELGNCYTALATLAMLQPHADCYAIFQDDVEAAQGLRAWCQQEFWPQGTGLVSLYTSRVYRGEAAGWRVLKLGFYRTFGGVALVFRPDVLERFLADGQWLHVRRSRPATGSDAVLGEWATRHEIGIAYHTPSLVEHIGTVPAIEGGGHGISGPVSTAEAVRSVEAIRRWKPPARVFGKVGLVGWNTASGLGYVNRDIAAHFPLAKWLVPRHQEFPTLPRPRAACPIDLVPLALEPSQLRLWLRGLDWVLFVELPYLERLAQHAHELGINVACVPMWEWTDLGQDWLNYVDLMLCPTRHAFQLLNDWKARFGFAWDVLSVPWPVDAERFRFRERERCRRFLFVNGTGGHRARKRDGSRTAYQRKGIELVLDTARLVPKIPWVVYSQIGALPAVPGNVEVRRPPAANERLYDDGDVCVQPSHWEGLGLQLLECQAAGLPLVTTDAPPMNEFQPLRAVAAADTELVSAYRNHVFPSHNVSPADLARAVESLYETDIAEASRQARRFVQREHSWTSATRLLEQVLVH